MFLKNVWVMNWRLLACQEFARLNKMTKNITQYLAFVNNRSNEFVASKFIPID